ncbi:MAG: hypothetical protein IH991_04490 [Planctomycetes bacterium]|nr:hypothetical protein [Planctomycetota bacterium]
MDSKGGTFVLTAQKGKSLNYRSAAELLARRQKPQWVELAVMGSPIRKADELTLKATVTGEPFRLVDDANAKSAKKPTPYQKLERAVNEGAKVVFVTGKVTETKPKQGEKRLPPTLIVTGFEVEDAK